MVQLNIFQSQINRDKGIKRAVDKAEAVNPGWVDKVIDQLRIYNPGGEFECSDFRKWVQDKVDLTGVNPRSFGKIMQRGMKEGIISFTTLGKTKNVKAHSANCNYYVKKI